MTVYGWWGIFAHHHYWSSTYNCQTSQCFKPWLSPSWSTMTRVEMDLLCGCHSQLKAQRCPDGQSWGEHQGVNKSPMSPKQNCYTALETESTHSRVYSQKHTRVLLSSCCDSSNKSPTSSLAPYPRLLITWEWEGAGSPALVSHREFINTIIACE